MARKKTRLSHMNIEENRVKVPRLSKRSGHFIHNQIGLARQLEEVNEFRDSGGIAVCQLGDDADTESSVSGSECIWWKGKC